MKINGCGEAAWTGCRARLLVPLLLAVLAAAFAGLRFRPSDPAAEAAAAYGARLRADREAREHALSVQPDNERGQLRLLQTLVRAQRLAYSEAWAQRGLAYQETSWEEEKRFKHAWVTSVGYPGLQRIVQVSEALIAQAHDPKVSAEASFWRRWALREMGVGPESLGEVPRPGAAASAGPEVQDPNTAGRRKPTEPRATTRVKASAEARISPPHRQRIFSQ